MGCTSGIMKCILNLINTIYLIAGIAPLAFGIMSLKSAPPLYVYLLIGVGCFMILVGLFGCCGICSENVCMTATYTVLIIISLVVLIFIQVNQLSKHDIEKGAREDVQKNWDLETRSPGAMDSTQRLFKCCGIDNPNNYYSIGRHVLPASCYPDSVISQSHGWHTKGCIQVAEEKSVQFYKYIVLSVWVAIGVSAVMLFFSIYLVFRFRNKENRYRY